MKRYGLGTGVYKYGLGIAYKNILLNSWKDVIRFSVFISRAVRKVVRF